MQMFLKKLFWSSGFNRSSKQRVTDLTQARRPLRLEALEDRRMLSITLFVDDDATSASPDGLAWDTAYADLQSALDRAAELNADATAENDITQIWIAEGTYHPTAQLEPDDPRSATFSLVDGVSLCGGFAGNETTLAERDLASHVTIFSGDLGVLDDNSDNVYTVVYCREYVEATIDGISVTDGNADDLANSTHYERGRGGGVYNNGRLTIRDSKLVGNSANFGGCICNNCNSETTNPVMIIINSTISNNLAYFYGGGIYNNSYTGNACIIITNSTLLDNSARSGGGIYNYRSTYSSIGLATFDKAAALLAGSKNIDDLLITDTTFSGNTASESGGGICNFVVNGTSTISITASTFSGNFAGSSGGGIINASNGAMGAAKLMISNSTFSENFATDSGGGICNTIGYYVMHLNTIGVASLTITNSTLSGNSTTGRGGGIYGGSEYSFVRIKNSIIAGNSASPNVLAIHSGSDIFLYSSGRLYGSHSLIGNGSGQTLVDGVDGNQIGTLESPVDPMFVDAENGDYRLMANSSAVNAGDNALAVDQEGLPLEVDLDGQTRIQGGAVDIGAYESSVGTWGNVWLKVRDRAGNEELEWMDEWTGCWVEVWGRGVAARGIGGFDVELGFVPDYFTPDMTKVVPGDAVDGEALTATLDGVAGKLRMEGSTLTDDAGQDAYVMLAKVYFKPTPGESSLPRDTDGRYLTPVEDVGFQLSEADLSLQGMSDHCETGVAFRKAVPLWPVMYDLDGNSTIDLMDVSQFVSVFQMTADENALPMAWASDFDRSGKVDLMDLSQMLARFHWQKGDGDSISYPDEFPFATPEPPDYVLQTDTTSSIWSIDDFDGEGVPDGTGVTILAGNWQYGATPLSVSAEPASASLCCNDAIFSNSLWDETDVAAVAKDLAIDAEEESFWLKDELFDLNLDLFDEY